MKAIRKTPELPSQIYGTARSGYERSLGALEYPNSKAIEAIVGFLMLYT